MTIKCQVLGGGLVAFSDITACQLLRPIHLGEILQRNNQTPLALRVYRFGDTFKNSRSRQNDIAPGRPGTLEDSWKTVPLD